jgi:polyisoprenoid-binding protein YceI
MRRFILFTAAAMIVALILSAEARATDYVVDTERSEFVVRLFKAGIAAAFAHDHVIRAAGLEGGGSFGPDEPGEGSIWIEVDVASLKADEPEVRGKYGLEKSMSDKSRQKIQATMLSAKQMDAANFPVISFRSAAIEAHEEGEYLISGDLTIHGVTKPISFPVAAEEVDGRLHGIASIDFKQSDYGIRPFSAMFGAVRNRDEAVLHADIYLLPSADE